MEEKLNRTFFDMISCLIIRIVLITNISFIFSAHFTFSQTTLVQVSGYVQDKSTGERLINATLQIPTTKQLAVTNNYGFYSIQVPSATNIEIIVSYVGYDPITKILNVRYDTLIDLSLSSSTLLGVTIEAKRNKEDANFNVSRYIQPSVIEIPKLMADIDILQIVKYNAGVQPALEGSVSYSVRGGNTDQNLIVMDDIPMYNTGHLFGIMSVFDPYAIQTMSFYKGGFPAMYGGRLASVLDVRLREGDKQEYHGEMNVGLLSGKLALEGPIKKGKSSFLTSWRHSTSDLLLRGFYLISRPEERFLYSFNDFTLKMHFQLNDKSNIHASMYHGGDRISSNVSSFFIASNDIERTFSNNLLNRWGNYAVSLRLNSILGKSAFNNLTLAYSDFYYNTTTGDKTVDDGVLKKESFFNYNVKVRDVLLKNDLEFNISERLTLRTGIHGTFHDFEPVRWKERKFDNTGSLESEINRNNFIRLDAFDLFGYFQSDIDFANNTSMKLGLRLGRYFSPSSVGFNLFEPRLIFNHKFDICSSLELSYARMGQFVHSLNSSGTALTPDVWIPTTERLGPAVSDLYSGSYKYGKVDGNFSFSAGLYYKTITGLIEFDGSGFSTIKGSWDEQFKINGRGESYGFELSTLKRFSKFFIETNYTLSRSMRQFDGINQGRWYFQNFDRPHNLTFTSVYKLSDKVSISGLFTYQSGQPITLSVQSLPSINNHSFYRFNNNIFNNQLPAYFEEAVIADDINNYRMPDYHRLDLALILRKNWKNGWRRELNFSVYNTYNRRNAYFIYIDRKPEGLVFSKLTLFPVLPSVSYSLKF